MDEGNGPAAGSSTDHVREILAKVKSVLYTRVNSVVTEHLASTVEMLCDMAADEEKLSSFFRPVMQGEIFLSSKVLLIDPLV